MKGLEASKVSTKSLILWWWNTTYKISLDLVLKQISL
jgi:hypothetical protein